MSNIIKYDFQGNLFSFNMDGWFNATEAAAKYGKRLDHWLNNADTLDYVRALDEVLNGYESNILNTRKSGYLKTMRGKYGGTWMHPKLAVAFARWLDPKFGVWCDFQIEKIVRNGVRAQGNQDLIPLYLRPDAADWELRFPPEYYHALARMTNTKYTGHIGGTPPLYGQITDKWVYSCLLPDEVHVDLKARKSKSIKMHQWLTDGGQKLLDKQISQVTAIAASSADYQDFQARMMALSNKRGQLSFVYPKVAA